MTESVVNTEENVSNIIGQRANVKLPKQEIN